MPNEEHTFLRIEDGKGLGPYVHPNISMSPGRVPHRPGPFDEAGGILRFDSDWIFGFIDLKQLLQWQWLEREVEDLINFDFRISIYSMINNNCRTFAIGKTQVVFKRADTILVAFEHITKAHFNGEQDETVQTSMFNRFIWMRP